MEKGRGGPPKEMGRKLEAKLEKAPERPVSWVEKLAREPKYAERARKSLREDYEAFKKGGEAAAQERHRIEKQFFERRSSGIAAAVDRGEIGRPIALIITRYFPRLNEKQIREVARLFPERRWKESLEEFATRKARYRSEFKLREVDEYDVREMVKQCDAMLEAYTVLERRGIRQASPNWPKRSDGSPRSLMINRSKLVALAHDIWKEGHPDEKPELKEGLRTERYEYRNEKGELIATCHAQYEQCVVYMPFEYQQNRRAGQLIDMVGLNGFHKKLTRCILEVAKTGKKIDLLKKAGVKNASLIVPERNVAFDGIFSAVFTGTDIAIVPKPDSPRSLAILLHEAGHFEQQRDLGFRNITGDPEALVRASIREYAINLKEVLRVTKESLLNSKHADRDRLIRAEDIDRIRAELDQMNHLLKKLGRRPIDWSATSNKELEEATTLLEQTYGKKVTEHFRKFDAFLVWRNIFSERDATRRAFLVLRELKREGADLSHKQEASLAHNLFTKGQTMWGRLKNLAFGDNYHEFLRGALKSHGADNVTVRKASIEKLAVIAKRKRIEAIEEEKVH